VGNAAPPAGNDTSLNATLSSLPTQPEVQLDIGLEILRRAFTQRVQELDDENKDVREMGKDKMQLAQVLEQKVAALEKTIDDLSNQCKDLAVENESLIGERDALASQHKKISHNVKALGAFKKNCSAFLDHKDDFDVETIHDSLPPHLRDMVADEAAKPPSGASSRSGRGSSRGAAPPQQPRGRRVAAPVHAARVAVNKGHRGSRGSPSLEVGTITPDDTGAGDAAQEEDAGDLDDALANMLAGDDGDQEVARDAEGNEGKEGEEDESVGQEGA